MAEAFPAFDIVDLSLLVSATDFAGAITRIQPVAETALDALSFQMQSALHVVAFSMIDATLPLHLGENRESQSHANADGQLAAKFAPLAMNFAWQEVPVPIPDLRAGRFPTDQKTRMTLWWYVKSLDTPYAIDKFVCLWTAVEILWADSGSTTRTPYVAPCGHTIDSCPECGTSLARAARGQSIQRFLREQGSLTGEVAARMWRLRQLLHGKDVFTTHEVQTVGELAVTLRASVLSLLKAKLDDPADQPPMMFPAGGPVMGLFLAASGIRALDDDDVRRVGFLEAVRAASTR